MQKGWVERIDSTLNFNKCDYGGLQTFIKKNI